MQDNEISIFDRKLGRKLREARQMRGLTQTALGQAIGVSYQQVQKNESGKSRISAERLDRICKFLDLPLGYFLDTQEPARSRWQYPAGTLRLATSIDNLPSDAIRKSLKSLVHAINTAWPLQIDT